MWLEYPWNPSKTTEYHVIYVGLVLHKNVEKWESNTETFSLHIVRRVVRHHSTVYWCLTVLLPSAHRVMSVRSTLSYNIITPISKHWLTYSRTRCGYIVEGAHWLNHVKTYTWQAKLIFTHMSMKLQGLKEEAGQHKHLHFLSTPPLISFYSSPLWFFQLLLTQLQVRFLICMCLSKW